MWEIGLRTDCTLLKGGLLNWNTGEYKISRQIPGWKQEDRTYDTAKKAKNTYIWSPQKEELEG